MFFHQIFIEPLLGNKHGVACWEDEWVFEASGKQAIRIQFRKCLEGAGEQGEATEPDAARR